MKRYSRFTSEYRQKANHMPRAQRKNMGKAQNNSTPNSTEPVEDSYNGISLEVTQDTDHRITITDIFKEIIELR